MGIDFRKTRYYNGIIKKCKNKKSVEASRLAFSVAFFEIQIK